MILIYEAMQISGKNLTIQLNGERITSYSFGEKGGLLALILHRNKTPVDQQVKEWWDTKTKRWATCVIFMGWNGHDKAWQEI